MYGLIVGLLMTTFVSVNGSVQTVDADSQQAVEYQTESVTDIGNPDNLVSTLSIAEESESFSDGDSVSEEVTEEEIYTDESQIVSLLSEQVELLAENSSTVTGTVNSQVLGMMDRIINDYPEYYKYAGFRVDADDSYRTTLYIAKTATAQNGIITFSDDCKAVNFYRTTSSSYTNYIYYTVTDSPGATVDVNSNSIVYTNVLDAYPTLGSVAKQSSDRLWIVIAVEFVIAIIIRRTSND